jgi:hypothetical protein
MPGGAEIVHATRSLAEGSVGAVVGLIAGIWMAPPRDCTELGNGLLECSNKVGQSFISATSTPVSTEWIGAIAGFVVVGSIAGWIVGAVWRALNPSDA